MNRICVGRTLEYRKMVLTSARDSEFFFRSACFLAILHITCWSVIELHMTFKVTALATLLGTASATTCQTLCDSLESCASDPNAKGSYCKTDESPQACFGLYYKDASLTAMCFLPNDAECSETYPVICPETPKPLTCQDVCKDVETCREDPHAHGSYCKFEEINPICFGMFAAPFRHTYLP